MERYVEKCIRSLQGQTYGHIEVILVDDASTDGSYDMCKAAIGGDSRFKLIRHPVNQGVAGARNLVYLWQRENSWVLWIRTIG